MARRRVRIKPKFYLLLILSLCCLAGLIALLVRDPSSGTLQAGTMTASIEAKAVLVRDEMCVSVEKYDRVNFIAREGESIYTGMPVAEVYKWGYSDDMNQSLASIRAQIYDAQMEVLAGRRDLCLALSREAVRSATRFRAPEAASRLLGVYQDAIDELARDEAAISRRRRRPGSTPRRPAVNSGG